MRTKAKSVKRVVVVRAKRSRAAAKLAKEVAAVVGDDPGAAEIVRAALRLISNRRRMI
jgi:hypothetical protein